MAVKAKSPGLVVSRRSRTGGQANRTASDSQRNGQRIELGEYVVADPLICHGKPTYKGTRIMVWQILQDLARGESVEELVGAWGGRVSRAAILETIRLAGGALLDTHGRLNRHLNGQLAA